MKINWNENPLMTTVDLDEADKKRLWYETAIEQLQWTISHVEFSLTEGKWFDLDRARKEVSDDYYWYEGERENSPFYNRINELVGYFVEALQGPHVGDCTCVAASCDKCHAEELLGINTIEGLGKHQAVKIHSAFGEYMRPWKRIRNITEVIDYLDNYDPADSPPDWAGWETHADRWISEAREASEWLKQYKIKRVD